MFIILTSLLIISSSVLSCIDSSLDNTELIFAFMIHRHGDRTPVERTLAFCTDPVAVNNLTSKYGLGQLTDVGISRSYQLGEFIRRRYGSLLSSRYNHSEIYLRSTDSTRAKMTMLAAMAATYPAGEDNWSQKINWTPVPYTTVPAKYDSNLAFYNCPVYIEKVENALVSQDPYMIAKYRELLEDFSEILGYNITNLPVILVGLHDAYISQPVYFVTGFDEEMIKSDRLEKLSLGVPVGSSVEVLLPELEEAAADFMKIMFGEEDYISLLSGVLLKDFFESVELILSGEDGPRVHVYSAHDVNVFAFQSITRITPRPGVPKFNSLYSLELRKEIDTGKYIIVPVYLDQPGRDETYLQMEGCEGFCDLDTFQNLTANYVIDEKQYRTLCNFSEDFNDVAPLM